MTKDDWLLDLGVQPWRHRGSASNGVSSDSLQTTAISHIRKNHGETTSALAADPPGGSEGHGSKQFTPPQGLSTSINLSRDDGEDDDNQWEQLQQEVAECRRCRLHRSRRNTVFGTGLRNPNLMIIGEAPGAEEDRTGEPFVGRAGRVLDAMLLAIGLSRTSVYIANILKCRPPGNRNPSNEESAHCQPYLAEQIRLLRPKLILALGRIAAHNLLGSDLAISKLRNEIHAFGSESIPLIVTYHPSYLLRSPAEKAKTWRDLQRINDFLSKIRQD